MKRLLDCLMGLSLLVGVAAQAKADYLFATLDVPGSTLTEAFGINGAGQIVGTYFDVAGTAHGFLLGGGSYTTLDMPGSTRIDAFGINNLGQIVGRDIDAAGTAHGFLWSSGSYTILDVPGSSFTTAYGVNNLGQIVGWYRDDTGYHGFLLDKGRYTTLGVAGSVIAAAYGINDAGQIVGPGYLLSGSSYTPLHFPGSNFTYPWGSTTRARSQGITPLVPSPSTASCSIRAPTPPSTRPAQAIPMPEG